MTLADIERQLAALTQDDLLGGALDVAMGALRAQRGCFLSWTSDDFAVLVARNLTRKQLEVLGSGTLNPEPGEFIRGALKQGEPLTKLINSSYLVNHSIAFSVATLLLVTCQVGGQTVGLYLDRRGKEGEYQPADLQFLSEIAGLIEKAS
jgi:hypothetical protein